MRDTSLMAYRSLTTTKLSTNRKAILDVLVNAHVALTDKEIASRLDWTINRVTGRRGELVKMGLVEKSGIVKRGATPETLWQIVYEEDELNF